MKEQIEQVLYKHFKITKAQLEYQNNLLYISQGYGKGLIFVCANKMIGVYKQPEVNLSVVVGIDSVEFEHDLVTAITIQIKRL